MSLSNDAHSESDRDSEPEMLAEDDVEEVVDDVAAMDLDDPTNDEDDYKDKEEEEEEGGGGEEEEVQDEEMTLHNDSVAYFDGHKDSVFAVAQHPLFRSLVATGGSEGPASNAPGRGYVLWIPPRSGTETQGADPGPALQPVFSIDGHSDSVTALAFSQPRGEVLYSSGMDGRLRAYGVSVKAAGPSEARPRIEMRLLGEASETDEIHWLAACPSDAYEANAVALGATNGSVWVYAADAAGGLRNVGSYFLHADACTAGAWTPDGALLATVAADGSLYVVDVWGTSGAQGRAVVSLTQADTRFAVKDGLYSVAVAPSGAYLAAGGSCGVIKIVGLPRTAAATSTATTTEKPRTTSRTTRTTTATTTTTTQAGAILASLAVLAESVESLSFSPAPATLLAAGSVDGSIAILDTARQFAVRRHLRDAHDGQAVVQVDFVAAAPDPAAAGWLLTSCGMDGVVRRWDLRAGTAAAGGGGGGGGGGAAVKEWRGHRGDGDDAAVLAFVQYDTGERVVTAGNDGLVLVFDV